MMPGISVGIAIFLLAFGGWLRDAATAHTGGHPAAGPVEQALGAKAIHVALYAFFIVMPLLGMATAWTDGKAVMLPFTDIALPALLAEDKDPRTSWKTCTAASARPSTGSSACTCWRRCTHHCAPTTPCGACAERAPALRSAALPRVPSPGIRWSPAR